MQRNTSDLERPMLRMGSISFLAGLAIAVVSTIIFHPSGTGEELMNNPFIFAVYAEDDLWIGTHIGQFAGLMLIYAGGFVALFRLLSRSDSGTTVASALAWFGFITSILTASALTILQAVDGIALKIAVDTWYAIPSSPSPSSEAGNGGGREGGEKATALRVAIAKSAILSRWIGAVGISAGVAGIAGGVITAYVGFSSVRDPVADLSTLLLYPWIVILGIFMWRKTRAKKTMTS